jgi:HK97 family phage portal protein
MTWYDPRTWFKTNHKEKIFSPNWHTLSGPTLGTYDAFGGLREPDKDQLVRAYTDIVYSATRLIQNKISTAKIRLFVKTEPGQARPKCKTVPLSWADRRHVMKVKGLDYTTQLAEVGDHELLGLLNKANPFHNRHELIGLTQLYLDLTGNAYWLIEEDDFGYPVELYPLPPQNVELIRDSALVVRGYRYTEGSRYYDYDLKDIIHFKNDNPLDPYGEGHSPVRGVWQRVQVGWKEISVLDNCLSNNARPDAILSPQNEISPFEAERLAKEFGHRFRGTGNGGIFVADGPMKLDTLNWPPRDLSELEIYKNLKTAVLNAFAIPPDIFELGTSSNRSTREAALYSLAADCIAPRLDRLIEKLNERLVPLFDSRLFLCADEIVPEDRAFELQERQMLLSTGVMTRAEARRFYNLPAEVWADEPLIPSGMLPAGTGEPVLTPEAADLPTSPLLPDAPAGQDDAGDSANDLRATVGGSQQVMAMQTAYYAGQIPREAAVANARIVFGFTEEEAEALFPEKPPEKLTPEEGTEPPAEPPLGLPQKSQKAEQEQEPELSAEEIHKLGKQFMAELLDEWEQEEKCGGEGGKPGPCPTGQHEEPSGNHPTGEALHQQAEGKARKVVRLMKELPGKVVAKVRQKVAKKYEELKERYGKGFAIAIMGAGLIGTATPVLGGGLIAAAPVLGVAELYLKYSGGKSLKAESRVLDVPDVRQEGDADCGAAATMAVCKFFGVGPDTEEEYVAALGTTEEEGTEAPRIAAYLEQLGLSVEASEGLTVEDLGDYVAEGKPVICAIQDYAGLQEEDRSEGGHYVVVIGVEGDSLTLQDPVAGRVSVERATFEDHWHDRGQKAESVEQCVARKIPVLIGEGYPEDQATAIAYRYCGEQKAEAPYTRFGIAVGLKVKGLKKKTVLPPLKEKSAEPMIEALKEFFGRQAKSVLGHKKTLDEAEVKALPAKGWFDLDQWTDEMYRQMLPMVEIYYDHAASQTVTRLGGDVELLKVVQPNLREAVAKATMLFCQSTQESTSQEIGAALGQLRTQIAEGLEVGDVKNAMMERVQKVFDRLSNERAYQIGHTEASRAQHNGMIITAQESGVAKAKRWILSSDACEICRPLAGKTVALDEPFMTDGTGPYAAIDSPPRHPLCRCAMGLVVEKEEE